jgi:hypothetical protein
VAEDKKNPLATVVTPTQAQKEPAQFVSVTFTIKKSDVEKVKVTPEDKNHHPIKAVEIAFVPQPSDKKDSPTVTVTVVFTPPVKAERIVLESPNKESQLHVEKAAVCVKSDGMYRECFRYSFLLRWIIIQFQGHYLMGMWII